MARFAHSRRLAKLAADLMAVDSIRIYYDKAMFKEPQSDITPLHQDGPHWPLASENVLTLWVALVDIPSSMGTMQFASGTHNRQAFGERGIDVERTEGWYRDYLRESGRPEPVEPGPIRAGDATVHNHWLVHGAGANLSDQVREVFGVTFYEGRYTSNPPFAYKQSACAFQYSF